MQFLLKALVVLLLLAVDSIQADRAGDEFSALAGAGEDEDNAPKKRNLRQSVQRITMETLQTPHLSCLGKRKIVQCKESVPEEVCKAALVQANVQVVSDMPNTVFFAICVDSEADAAVVAALTDVEDVEDDQPRTLMVVKGSRVERHLQSSEQVTPYGIDLVKAPEFWARYDGNQGAGIKVCVIDTGLRSSHEDIRDGDLSGSDGDWPNLLTPWSDDIRGHGTHVAGTIAAQDNGRGVVGVAPQASLHIIRALSNDGGLLASDLVVAMTACANANATVISMSLGGPTSTNADASIAYSLHDLGILLVASSGNDGDSDNPVSYPAYYNGVLSVAAVDRFSRVAYFSTHNTAVDIAAPGVDVLSLGNGDDSAYISLSGTSMAAPHVAGVAALLWSQFPNKTVTEIEEAMTASARDLGACGRDRLSGHGVVDVVAAAMYLEGNSTTSDDGNCVSVDVALTTDDYGTESLYIVTSEHDPYDILYRGGPYPGFQRFTYVDSFSLPDGCYSLMWLDKIRDGNNDPTYGIGELALDYGGVRQVLSDGGLSGGLETFRFGSCGENSNSATGAPVPAPNQPPPAQDSAVSSGCGADESYLEFSLFADIWSPYDNHMHLYQDTGIMLRVLRGVIAAYEDYESSTCVNPEEECYKFYFMDDFGDGLLFGGFTMSLDGEVVLQILPGDQGDIVEEGSPAVVWYKKFGKCT